MIQDYKTKIVEELRVPTRWECYDCADVIVQYENGSQQKVLMNEEAYKINKALEKFKEILSEQDFTELVDAIEEYGSDKYHDGCCDEAESESI